MIPATRERVAAAVREVLERAFNPNQPRDPDGKWTDGSGGLGADGMPTEVVSRRAAGGATVTATPGGQPRLSLGGGSAELSREEREQFRRAINAASDLWGPDGTRPGEAGSTQEVRRDGEVLVSVRPVPGRVVGEDGKVVNSVDEVEGMQDSFPAEYEVTVGGGRPVTVRHRDLAAQNRNGMYESLVDAAAARRVDGGAGPMDVFVPKSGRVGFRMKGDDGKPAEVEFGSRDIRRLDSAIDAVRENPGTRTVDTSRGPVEVTYTDGGSLIVSPPSGGPWSLAATGDGVADLMNAFNDNAYAAGIFR